jgi:cytochrome oxidase Cu insertion factor (SCO1/SenC/PrrC family)
MRPVRFPKLLAVLGLCAPLLCTLSACSMGPDTSVGALAPEIAATDLDGVPFKLSDYRGKVVLLDFWGFW